MKTLPDREGHGKGGDVLRVEPASNFLVHYHQERNHQRLDNKIIQPEFNPLPRQGTIRCRKRLGGVLRYHYREAA